MGGANQGKRPWVGLIRDIRPLVGLTRDIRPSVGLARDIRPSVGLIIAPGHPKAETPSFKKGGK